MRLPVACLELLRGDLKASRVQCVGYASATEIGRRRGGWHRHSNPSHDYENFIWNQLAHAMRKGAGAHIRIQRDQQF
jgi:hypothetical protein